MSKVSQIALTLSNAPRHEALDTIAESIAFLAERYDYGFRSYGGILTLDFQGTEIIAEDFVKPLDPTLRGHDRAELGKLAKRYKWFGIMGSILFPGFENLADFHVLLVPTGQPERPACVIFRFESELYLRVWKDGTGYDPEAAEALLQLCIALGTSRGVDGFEARLVEEIDEVPRNDGAGLVRFLTDAHCASSLDVARGFVTGIRRASLSESELQSVGKLWSSWQFLDTTNGFLIINGLIAPPSL